MSKTLLTIVLGLSLAACKTDKSETASSEKSAEPTKTANGPKPRSGKIDLPTVKPHLPTDDPDDDSGATMQGREERRKQRMAQFDTDGDGKLSEAEREAIRAKREAEMKARLDKNKDGDGKVTPAELESAPFGRFDATADANGDGQVSVEELEAVMKDRMSQRGGGFRGRRGMGRGSAE